MDGIDFSENLRRVKFEELNNELFRGIMILVEKVFKDVDKIKD